MKKTLFIGSIFFFLLGGFFFVYGDNSPFVSAQAPQQKVWSASTALTSASWPSVAVTVPTGYFSGPFVPTATIQYTFGHIPGICLPPYASVDQIIGNTIYFDVVDNCNLTPFPTNANAILHVIVAGY